MSDHRPFDRFQVLDRPIEPEAAFAERLFEALAADLGFRPVTRREAVVRRFADASPAVRLAYLAAILGLLLAAVLAAALVGAQLFQPKTAAEIVSASQAAQLDPPAYDMTIRADDGRITRVRMDGQGAWRWDRISDPEMPDMPAGTYEVHVGGQVGRYDPGYNSWSLSADDAPPNASLLGWQLPFEPSTTGSRPAEWFSCPSWERLADDVIADRPAYHVACGAREFWVDEESSLLVGVRWPPGVLGATVDDAAGISGKATAFALAPTFPPDTFTLSGPAGAVAVDPNNPPASTVLAVGRSAPRLTGTTLDGTTVDTSAQAGPLVVYFWATWCSPCTGPQLSDLQTVATRHAPSVTTVTIATLDQLGSVTGYVNATGIRLPVVNDSGSLLKSWGISAIPALVMLDRSGAVAALRLGPVPASELEQMYAALAAGEPVPTPSATPVPSSEAPPTYAPGATETISGLAIGDLAPTWSGPLLNGGTLEGSSLVGKPTVIWFGPSCADCPTTDLEAFEAAHRQVGSEANFVVVAGGEPTPGWTAALFQRLGITVPLVFDWDTRIGSAFKLTILPTIVLDASGRVAYVAPGAMSTEQILGLVRKLKPESTVPAP